MIALRLPVSRALRARLFDLERRAHRALRRALTSPRLRDRLGFLIACGLYGAGMLMLFVAATQPR